MIEIVIAGSVPAKKNLLRFAAGRKKPFYDPEVRATLDDIADQVADQWSGRAPLIHPSIIIVFYGVSDLSDRDNKFTTLMDALVSGGVLKDDNVLNCNGEMMIGKAYGGNGSVGARIFVEPNGSLMPLYNKVSKLEDLESYKVLRPASSRRGFRRR